MAGYQARSVDIDGCVYREGLSAVRVDGGVAGNVIPDAASVTVNFRFAPDRSADAALRHVHDVFDGLDVRIEQTDSAAGALPGLSTPAARALIDAADGQVRAKVLAAMAWAGEKDAKFIAVLTSNAPQADKARDRNLTSNARAAEPVKSAGLGPT